LLFTTIAYLATRQLRSAICESICTGEYQTSCLFFHHHRNDARNQAIRHGRRETVSLLDVLPRKEPCVQPPPCDFQCRTSFRTHVTAGNMLPPGGKPTSAQLKAAAAAITTWAEEAGMVTLFNDIDTGVRAVGENMFVNQPMNES
jgi:hypothetical protein